MCQNQAFSCHTCIPLTLSCATPSWKFFDFGFSVVTWSEYYIFSFIRNSLRYRCLLYQGHFFSSSNLEQSCRYISTCGKVTRFKAQFDKAYQGATDGIFRIQNNGITGCPRRTLFGHFISCHIKNVTRSDIYGCKVLGADGSGAPLIVEWPQ